MCAHVRDGRKSREAGWDSCLCKGAQGRAALGLWPTCLQRGAAGMSGREWILHAGGGSAEDAVRKS